MYVAPLGCRAADVGRRRTEQLIERFPNVGERDNSGDGDQRGDETVFDGGCALGISQEPECFD